MKIALLGDVHGNLEGLKAVIEALEGEGVERWFCLGDIVGYGANPNECCAVLRDLGALCLFGNHDQACIGQGDMAWFNPFARQAVAWTAARLDPRHRDWLASLEPVQRLDDFVMVHSALPDPWRWVYVTSPALAGDTLDAAGADLVLLGHTHVAEVYRRVSGGPVRRVSLREGGEVFINSGGQYVVNPGSCGQPRDRNWKASYGLWDTVSGKITVRRVPYDVERAADKIRRAGLPENLALRLHLGR